MSRQTLFILALACSLVVAVPVKAQFIQGYGIRAGSVEVRYNFSITDLMPDLDEWTVQRNELDISLAVIL